MTEGYADDLVVLSGFSGQPMGDDDGGPRDVVAGQFMAAASGTPEGDFYDTDDDGEFGDARRIDSWIQREWVRPTAVEQWFRVKHRNRQVDLSQSDATEELVDGT